MGGCSSKEDEAPHLDEYFRVLAEERPGQMDDLAAALEAAKDTEGTQRKQKELHAKLRPIIERSFTHHDSNKNGVLDGEEAKAFFDHYITRYAIFSKEVGQLQIQQTQIMGLAMMGGMTEGGMAKEVQNMAQQQKELSSKLLEDAVKDYHDKATEYNQAALSVLDKSRNGKIFMDIVVDALLPGTGTNYEFSNCFPTGPKHMMHKTLAQMKENMESKQQSASINGHNFVQDSGLATQTSDYQQATPFCFTAQAKVPMAQSFQVKLSGAWTDYSNDEDKILKRAYLAGFENAKYSLRGQKYECNFKAMTQKNLQSGKVREMRPPHKWKAPPSQIVKPGETFCVKVPPGGPGAIIHVPHPTMKGQLVAVNVPAKAKVGQAMLVPLPTSVPKPVEIVEPDAPQAAEVAKLEEGPAKEAAKKKWSTGAKVAAGTTGVAVVGGVAVAGAVLGQHLSEDGWDATIAELGDIATSAGDGIAEGASHVANVASDTVESVGDFVMDLF